MGFPYERPPNAAGEGHLTAWPGKDCASTGSLRVTVVPTPILLDTSTVPPCARTIQQPGSGKPYARGAGFSQERVGQRWGRSGC